MTDGQHNSESFLVLVTGAQRVLHAFILKLVTSLTDADDILQETGLLSSSGASRGNPRWARISLPGRSASPATR